ncbi:MAG: DNA-directed RNA polymerase subunit omega [Chitinophagales bacterium]|nr:DNA-directed RNA polymerase subunit omega [Chitinophagales bacterium]
MKKQNIANLSPTIETRDLNEMSRKTGNLYEAIAIINKRAKQINVKTREELHAKLNEFASATDNLEEVFENREQIEISKYYEKLPSAQIIALEEFMTDEVYFRKPTEEQQAQ